MIIIWTSRSIVVFYFLVENNRSTLTRDARASNIEYVFSFLNDHTASTGIVIRYVIIKFSFESNRTWYEVRFPFPFRLISFRRPTCAYFLRKNDCHDVRTTGKHVEQPWIRRTGMKNRHRQDDEYYENVKFTRLPSVSNAYDRRVIITDMRRHNVRLTVTIKARAAVGGSRASRD